MAASQPSPVPAYVPKAPCRSTFLDLGRLRYHVREWGDPDAPLVFMLHGWMDVAASFQFLVDELSHAWHVVAPDWRGYGLTDWSNQGCYWIPDYLFDLEKLLDHFSPNAPVRLVGHSMGGNIAVIYAGVRAHRVRAVVNLEGLGLPGDPAQAAGGRLARWLDEMREPPTLRSYASYAAVVERLQKTNPQLRADRAQYLAAHWSRQATNGRFEILADPAHKVVDPYLYRSEEAAVVWAAIAAPVLWIMATDSAYAQQMQALPEFGERLLGIAKLRRQWLPGAGHMMHHDCPTELARGIEDFFDQTLAEAPPGARAR